MHAPESSFRSLPLTTPPVDSRAHILNHFETRNNANKWLMFSLEPNNSNMREHLLQFCIALTVAQGCLFIVSCGVLCLVPLCWWNMLFYALTQCQYFDLRGSSDFLLALSSFADFFSFFRLKLVIYNFMFLGKLSLNSNPINGQQSQDYSSIATPDESKFYYTKLIALECRMSIVQMQSTIVSIQINHKLQGGGRPLVNWAEHKSLTEKVIKSIQLPSIWI